MNKANQNRTSYHYSILISLYLIPFYLMSSFVSEVKNETVHKRKWIYCMSYCQVQLPPMTILPSKSELCHVNNRKVISALSMLGAS